MKILVTGGAGFIGSNFIRYWQKNYPRDHIVNFDKLTYAGTLSSLRGIKKTNYTFIQADVANPRLVSKALKGIHTVVHFAAESHVDRSITGPALFVRTNVLGTHNLLQASLEAGIKRFHYISTDEVFGALKLGSKTKFNELTLFDPRSPYSASKAAGQHLVMAYFHTYGLPVSVTNCSNNYGPYQYPEKLIPLAITNLIDAKNVPVYGDGRYVRDWLHVEDHCRAIDLVLKAGKVGETYCVGGMTKDVNNLTLVKKMLKIMKKDSSFIEYIKDRPGHDRRYAVDWSKINTELGWKPEKDFESWLCQTVKWYQDNEWWWRPLKIRKP